GQRVVGEPDTGVGKELQRRLEQAALSQCGYKHTFTALPALRSRNACSKSVSTVVASKSGIASFGVAICSSRSRLNEKPTAGRSSPKVAGSPSYRPPLATSKPRPGTYARNRMPV